MLQTPSIADDKEDNVTLISSKSDSANAWTEDQLKSLFDHFTNRNTSTNARLDVLDSRSQQIYSTAASITSSLKGLEENLQAKIAIHGGNLTELADRADKAEEELNSLASQARYAETAVGRLESRSEALEIRSKALEETDELLKQETEAIRGRVELLEPGQKALENTSRKLLEDTDLLKGRTEQQAHQFKWAAWVSGGAILALAATMITATSWTGLSQGTEVSGEISVLRADVMGQINRIESNQSGIAEVQQSVGVLQEQIDAGFTESKALQKEYGSLSHEVRDLDGRLLAMDGQFQDVGGRLVVMDKQVQQELKVIKERIYADDVPLPGAAVDLGFLHDASWLQAQNPGNYVVQLVNVYRKQDLADFVARHQKSLTMDQLSYFKTLHRGRDMYVLLYGNFPKFNQAMSGMEALPAAIQRNRPFLRSIKGVNDTIM